MPAHKSAQIGLRSGKLTVIEDLGVRQPAGASDRAHLVRARCDCGKEFTTRYTGIFKRGQAACYGCARRKRYRAEWPEYGIWAGMKSRCTNPNETGYPHYGGRGIQVCERWRESFEAFIEDIGRRPSPEHWIDRVDNDGNYEPGNVRWEIPAVQNRNHRRNRWIEFNGERLVLQDWAIRYGLSFQCLSYRLDVGWPVEKALTTPSARGV